MGQVFTWEAIRDNDIPRIESFNEVIQLVKGSMAEQASILGAVACGSVIRGDHTIRSDLDCFVLYDVGQEHAAFTYMQKMAALAESRAVPLYFLPCDSWLAQIGMHHVGTSFQRHLRASADAGGLLKGDPLPALAQSVPEWEELTGYIRVKMYTLQEGWGRVHTFSDEQAVAYLKKLLEAPMHIARKTLACFGPLQGDSKAHILSEYRKTFPTPMGVELDHLVEQDALYTEALIEQIERPHEREYRELLHHMMNLSEDVLRFIRANLAFIVTVPR